MEGRFPNFHAARQGSPTSARHARRRRLVRCIRQLAVAVAAMVATVVVSAPAGAWPEIGG